MADITSFAQASEAFAAIRRQLTENEEIASVRSFAAENADVYQNLMNNERYARFDSAVRSVMSAAEDTVRVPIQRAVNTVNYAAGYKPKSFQEYFREAHPDYFERESSASITGVGNAAEAIKGNAVPIVASNASSANAAGAPPASVSGENLVGHPTYSAYLNSHQEQMTAANAKDVDYNILSELAYAAKYNKYGSHSAEYAKAAQQEGVTIKQYCEDLLKNLDETPENLIERNFLKEMAASERYGGLTIDHAIGSTGTGGSQTQVLVIGTGDGHAVMAVEGTNGTVKDWQNNAGFAGSEPIEEERWVTSVVNRYASEYDSFDLTGHSQGGREAITAGIFMDDANKSKLNRIVSNDGPGYSDAFFEKYGDRIKTIEGKVTNIRPDGSYVGRLLNGVGEEKVVESVSITTGYDKDGKPKHTVIHEGTCWYVDENGNYVEAESSWWSDSIQNVTPVLTEFLCTYMPEERVEYYIGEVFALFGDENGDLSFSKSPGEILDAVLKAKDLGAEFIEEFKAGMDKVNQEQLSDFEYSLLIVCEEYNEFYSKVDGWLTAAETFCGVMTVVLSESVVGAMIFSVLGEAIEIVHTALKIVDYVCKGVRILLNVVAYIRAAEKKKKREAYIANNPELKVQIQSIRDAALYLYRVASDLKKADECYNDMLYHFKSKIRGAVTDFVQDIVGESDFVESISDVSRMDAIVHCRIFGVKSVGNTGIGRLNNGASTLNEIADKSFNLLAEASLPGGPYFRVEPLVLSQAGADGASGADMIQEQTENVDGWLASMKGEYIGEDADSLNAKWAEYDEQLVHLAEQYRTLFDNLQKIADAYSKYQNDTIETFQNMKLGLGFFD